jgi:hypothetical protein
VENEAVAVQSEVEKDGTLHSPQVSQPNQASGPVPDKDIETAPGLLIHQSSQSPSIPLITISPAASGGSENQATDNSSSHPDPNHPHGPDGPPGSSSAGQPGGTGGGNGGMPPAQLPTGSPSQVGSVAAQIIPEQASWRDPGCCIFRRAFKRVFRHSRAPAAQALGRNQSEIQHQPLEEIALTYLDPPEQGATASKTHLTPSGGRPTSSGPPGHQTHGAGARHQAGSSNNPYRQSAGYTVPAFNPYGC